MVGNTEGLGFFDAMNLELIAVKEQLASIHAPELLKYLPAGKKRPDTYKRNELVHGGNVKFDLQFLKSVKRDFLIINNIQRDDLLIAFRNRYGDYPEAFPGDLPAR